MTFLVPCPEDIKEKCKYGTDSKVNGQLHIPVSLVHSHWMGSRKCLHVEGFQSLGDDKLWSFRTYGVTEQTVYTHF
jgi:hypothetical protein